MNTEFEKVDLSLDYPLDPYLINGSGLFSILLDDYPSIHLRPQFSEHHEKLIEEKFHHQLSSKLLEMGERRKNSSAGLFGGGKFVIDGGRVSVLWMSEEQAMDLFSDSDN